jgi:hypothetical protein
MLRRIRSALILGLLWAVVWLPIGVVAGAAFRWIAFPLQPIDWAFFGMFTGLGFASGATFGALLSRLKRGQTVEGIRPGRLAVWGPSQARASPFSSVLSCSRSCPGTYIWREAPTAYSRCSAFSVRPPIAVVRLF